MRGPTMIARHAHHWCWRCR